MCEEIGCHARQKLHACVLLSKLRLVFSSKNGAHTCMTSWLSELGGSTKFGPKIPATGRLNDGGHCNQPPGCSKPRTRGGSARTIRNDHCPQHRVAFSNHSIPSREAAQSSAIATSARTVIRFVRIDHAVGIAFKRRTGVIRG